MRIWSKVHMNMYVLVSLGYQLKRMTFRTALIEILDIKVQYSIDFTKALVERSLLVLTIRYFSQCTSFFPCGPYLPETFVDPNIQ